jgi:hypothetical protein
MFIFRAISIVLNRVGVIAVLFRPTPMILVLVFNFQGRRDKPGDSARVWRDFNG